MSERDKISHEPLKKFMLLSKLREICRYITQIYLVARKFSTKFCENLEKLVKVHYKLAIKIYLC